MNYTHYSDALVGKLIFLFLLCDLCFYILGLTNRAYCAGTYTYIIDLIIIIVNYKLRSTLYIIPQKLFICF